MNNSIAFFTEAGTKKGMGHLIRCYTIFSTLNKNGFQGDFYLDSDQNFDDKLNDIQYFTWDTLQLHKSYTIIFIDSYLAQIDIYNKLKVKSKHLVCLDDYARIDYPPCTIINFAPDADKTFYLNKRSNYHYLLGIDYIPIRDTFFNTQYIKEEQIFIMLGGNDTANISAKILASLLSVNIKKTLVTSNKTIDTIYSQKNQCKILYKPNDTTLVQEMAKSSIAITTASMSAYELALLKTPTIIIATSHNQLIGAKKYLTYNLANDYIDINKKDWLIKLKQSVLHLKNANISKSKGSKIDGLGTQRILEYVKTLS